MHRRLLPYLDDEKKALQDYEELSGWAEIIGRPDIAHTLTLMAQDESRHYVNIRAIMRDLRNL